MPSGLGVSKTTVVLAPGARGAMVEPAGKQEVVGHPAGALTASHATSKPCGFVPLLVSVSVTCAKFSVSRICRENPASSTARSKVYAPPPRPLESAAQAVVDVLLQPRRATPRRASVARSA